MKSKFIVFEGLDKSGKTTIAKALADKDKGVYIKGVPSNTFFGSFVRKFPFTILFILDLLYLTYFYIKPTLKQNKTVLQDRYLLSIESYVPISARGYNKLFLHLIKKLLLEPDLLIYLYLPKKERIRRLKKAIGKYENILINNPLTIKKRERSYNKNYNNFKGEKIRINTNKHSINTTINILCKLLSKTPTTTFISPKDQQHTESLRIKC